MLTKRNPGYSQEAFSNGADISPAPPQNLSAPNFAA
jgi:hypothetical protein